MGVNVNRFALSGILQDYKEIDGKYIIELLYRSTEDARNKIFHRRFRVNLRCLHMGVYKKAQDMHGKEVQCSGFLLFKKKRGFIPTGYEVMVCRIELVHDDGEIDWNLERRKWEEENLGKG